MVRKIKNKDQLSPAEAETRTELGNINFVSDMFIHKLFQYVFYHCSACYEAAILAERNRTYWCNLWKKEEQLYSRLKL